ncbi:MAG: hypothetical protein AAGE52_34930 [Myxococcota bacterium]
MATSFPSKTARTSPSGPTRERYEDLYVEDAHGTRLDATLRAANGLVEIVIPTLHAVFPVVVDPTFRWVRRTAFEDTARPGATSVAADGVYAYLGGHEFPGAMELRGLVARRTSLSVWEPHAEINYAGFSAIDFFGSAAAIHGDTLVVGAPGIRDPSAALVFVRAGSSWIEEQRLTLADSAHFGRAVAISGDRAAVSGWRDSEQIVAVFERTDSTWTLAAEVAPADLDHDPGDDRSNWDVAIDDEVVAIGAAGANERGAVFLVARETDGTWSHRSTLLPTVRTVGGDFGRSVDLHGETLVVGEPKSGPAERGAAYVFSLNPSGVWTESACLTAVDSVTGQQFGAVVDLDRSERRIIVSPHAAIRPGAYLFELEDSWRHETKFSLPETSTRVRDVALSGTSAWVVTAPDNDAYVFALLEFSDAPIGDGCSADTDCDSGHCVEGVCCESPCDRGCESCRGSGEDGRCRPRSAGIVCAPARGVCENDAVCDGVSALCTHTPRFDVCRAATDRCDVAERCNRTSFDCPPDRIREAGDYCRSATSACDTFDVCNGVSKECRDRVLPAGTLCREPEGPCDTAEVCDGVSNDCPADSVETAGTVCREPEGLCDAAEVCDGESNACPADLIREIGTPCRAPAGVCDLGEFCDGRSVECPGNRFLTNGTSCPGGVCAIGICVTCEDGVQNGDETGIDCGGSCVACPTCTDGLQNGSELGIDCGGGCEPCATCEDGLRNGGELGVDCGGECEPCPSCTDGFRNGDELDVDCGGSCAACPTCDDEIQNGDELGVDCGGDCAPCSTATCADGVQNGDETDVDCGGTCDPCAAGETCDAFTDCRSRHCDRGRCVARGAGGCSASGSEGPLWAFLWLLAIRRQR